MSVQTRWFVFSVVVGALFLSVTGAHSQQAAPRKLPERTVPVPSTISEDLSQKAVSLPVRVFPLPKTDAEWKAAQQSLDADRAQTARAAAESVGATLKEQTIAGVRCFEITPKTISATGANRLLVHVHGGAYVLGSGAGGALEGILVATAAGTRVISVDYRMPPDHPFPAAVDDAVAVWKDLVARHDRSRMALFGTSAGGGLAMATVLSLKEHQLPLPAALFLGTPWTDLTKTGDSYFTHAELDNVLGRYEGFLELSARLYAGKTDLKNPLISPAYGDLAGFPPTLLVTGTRDLFLSNTVRAHRKLRAAGVKADLHVFEAQSHADYLRAFPAPESREMLDEVARFFDQHLAK
jgi:acetyl esterase/lipase